MALIPVSYTHLDVYKRQALSTWFRVIRAGNGKEALEILTRQSVDVIVSDVMMPEKMCIRDSNYVV